MAMDNQLLNTGSDKQLYLPGLESCEVDRQCTGMDTQDTVLPGVTTTIIILVLRLFSMPARVGRFPPQ